MKSNIIDSTAIQEIVMQSLEAKLKEPAGTSRGGANAMGRGKSEIFLFMTTERDKCGLSSLLPMSCRGRAEAFARRLHSRLRSLGSEDEDNGSSDESSWLTATSTSSNDINSTSSTLALVQPHKLNQIAVDLMLPKNSSTSSENDIYLDFDNLLESPASPVEEPENLDFGHVNRVVNGDGLNGLKNGTTIRERSNDSDSDGSFYDTEDISLDGRLNKINNELDKILTINDSRPETTKKLNGDTNGGIKISVIDQVQEKCNGISTSTSTSSNCNGFETEVGLNSSNGLDSPSESASNSTDQTGSNFVSCLTIPNDLVIECPLNQSSFNADEDEEERIPRVRRCSSLKTGKTPPGTPGRKKNRTFRRCSWIGFSGCADILR